MQTLALLINQNYIFFLLDPSVKWEFYTFFRKVRYSFNRRSCYNYHHSYHCPATTTTTATSTRGSGTQQFFKWAWDYHWPQWFCPKTGGQMCWCKGRIGTNGSKWDLYEDQTSSTQSQKERNACSTGYDKSRIERKRSCGMSTNLHAFLLSIICCVFLGTDHVQMTEVNWRLNSKRSYNF